MTTIKISALPTAGAILGPEILPAVQGGITKATTAEALQGVMPFGKFNNAAFGQTIPSGVITKILLDGAEFDPAGMFLLATNEIEIKITGFYDIWARGVCDSGTYQLGMYVKKNGAGSVVANVMPASAVANSIIANNTASLVAGDKLTLWAVSYLSSCYIITEIAVKRVG